MADKRFTQDELNKIIVTRVKRERDRLTKEFENKLKRCMAAIHLTLYQEMCSLKWELDTEKFTEQTHPIPQVPKREVKYMDANMQVTCLLDRSWNPSSMEFEGTESDGTLIEISFGSSEENPGVMIPLGIVLLDDNTFQSVPMEFICKKNV